MNSTGIIRRIDDLGRIVIPREIRQRMKIKEDDPFEIYCDNSDIILKRYKIDIEEQWHNACEAYLKWYYENPNFEDVRFIYRNGVTTCIGFTSKHNKCIGTSKWNASKDKYDPIIGQAISLCRAIHDNTCDFRDLIGLEG